MDDSKSPSSSSHFAFMIGLLKGGLHNFFDMKTRDPFSVSPATEQRVRSLLASLDSGDFTGIRNSIEYGALAAEMSHRVRVDFKYAKALERLDDLSVLYFPLRYGDYFASGLEEFQKIPRRVITPPSEVALPKIEEEALAYFETREWAEISERLEREPGFRDPYRALDDYAEDASPIYHLIHVLASLNYTSPHYIIEAIQGYVDRKTTPRNRLAELAAANKMKPVLTTVIEDLQNLRFVPAACREAVPTVREAIFATISRYFTSFLWDEGGQMCRGMKWRGDSLDMAVVRVVQRGDKDYDALILHLGFSDDELEALKGD